ncbi:MAG TPA: preprotein translocase subunit YajC [Frankiaceae bacterium]|nr:preprotein translocase subunit YajC [Frankiaceae bacterium]
MTSAVVFAAASKSNSSVGLIFPLLLVAVVGFLFYTQRKRKAQGQQMQSALKVGSKIMTTAGLFATVVSVEDDGVVLEVAPGVHSKYARAAISRVLDAPEGAEPLDDDGPQPPSVDLDKEPPSNP